MSKTPDAWGSLVDKIIEAITSLGPMTSAELQAHLRYSASSVSRVLSRMTRDSPRRPQRLHVSGWVTDQEGQRTYPRAQYSLGPGINRPYKRAVTAKAAHSKRQGDKLRMLKTSSVFNLGVTRAEFAARKNKGVPSKRPHG